MVAHLQAVTDLPPSLRTMAKPLSDEGPTASRNVHRAAVFQPAGGGLFRCVQNAVRDVQVVRSFAQRLGCDHGGGEMSRTCVAPRARSERIVFDRADLMNAIRNISKGSRSCCRELGTQGALPEPRQAFADIPIARNVTDHPLPREPDPVRLWWRKGHPDAALPCDRAGPVQTPDRT